MDTLCLIYFIHFENSVSSGGFTDPLQRVCVFMQFAHVYVQDCVCVTCCVIKYNLHVFMHCSIYVV